MKNKIVPDLTVARRLRAAGCRIYIEEDDGEARAIPSQGLRVYQVGGVTESRAIAIRSYGGVAFLIHLCITIKLPNFAISTFNLELPWKNEYFWLQDPLETDGRSENYCFAGLDLEFHRSQVLNHYADVRKTYSLGRSLTGALLGFGFDAIPEKFRQGEMIPGFLDVYDQFDSVFRCPVKLWADRSRLTRSRAPSKRGRLFDCPDPGFERAPLDEDEAHK